MLCIDGPSGAGKTTLAHAVLEEATRRGISTALVHCDDLLDGWNGLETMPAALVDQVAVRLHERRVLHHRCYDWLAGHFSTPRLLPVADLYVFEGVGSGALALAPWTDLLVWVEADARVRRDRARHREASDVLPWFDAWAADEYAHHAREHTRERADLIVAT